MPTEFKLPELGENISAGDVVRILVSEGDTIARDQAILELETDKATIEVPSTVAGAVKAIKVKQGDRIKVGQTVLTLDDGGQSAGAGPAKGASDKAEAAAKPETAHTDAAKPKAQPAGAAERGGLSQEESDAVPSSRGAGRGAAERDRGRVEGPESQQADAGASRPKRGEVVDIGRGTARPAAASPPAEDVAAGPAAPAAPSVRRLARELGVDIRRVTGSGADGRITPDDVQAFVRAAMSGGAGAAAAVPLPDFAKWGDVERKPMSNIRRKTAEHLSHAWNAIPHVTQHDRADITTLEELRRHYAPQAERAGGKMTPTAIALKIVAGALKKFPEFNSSVDVSRSEIVYRKSIHVGVAVDTERGLLVPVIRDVDRKGIVDLSVELTKASEKARAGKLSLDDMQGGGFTITNLGGIGGTSFTPIINWPEVAILGISRGSHEPVWQNGAFVPRLMLPLSLSYDHRVIDGANAARFLRWVCEAFEQPFVLAL
jgi:pyruvate dehydrogenase E2 component (dihydrolipoyllysine-residue acetyltransferase)